MAYYLGRDVVVALTTEDDQYGIGVTAAGGLQTPQYNEGPDPNTNVFAGPRARYNVANSPNTNFSSGDTTVLVHKNHQMVVITNGPMNKKMLQV